MQLIDRVSDPLLVEQRPGDGGQLERHRWGVPHGLEQPGGGPVAFFCLGRLAALVREIAEQRCGLGAQPQVGPWRGAQRLFGIVLGAIKVAQRQRPLGAAEVLGGLDWSRLLVGCVPERLDQAVA